jgi:hypothetical protein
VEFAKIFGQIFPGESYVIILTKKLGWTPFWANFSHLAILLGDADQGSML